LTTGGKPGKVSAYLRSRTFNGVPAMKRCLWCKKEFKPKMEWQKFCCKKCKIEWHKKARKLGAALLLKEYDGSKN